MEVYIPPVIVPQVARINKWQKMEGMSFPMGVTVLEDALNFTLYSKHATSVKLIFYKDVPGGEVERCDHLDIQLNPMMNKSERIWHVIVDKQKLHQAEAKYYAYRIGGPGASGKHDDSHAFDPEKTLIDPFARAVYFPKSFKRAAACEHGDNELKSPLAVIQYEPDKFDWQGTEKPVIDPSTLIIYELHVRQFTRGGNNDVNPANTGFYTGIVDMIPYLKELGITAVELMPVHQYDPQEYSEARYHWGYMTLNFFSPHHDYSSNQTIEGAISEFKKMVSELHKEGIAVVLDVVYNHTTEGNHKGPHYSFKGIDNSTYYMTQNPWDSDWPNTFSYSNFAGVGNTLHTANAHTANLILESLRFWANEMQVDGFRFDLGTIFLRNSDGSINNNASIISEISSDPLLRNLILIAEPWDIESYNFGKNFPGLSWRQWNDNYRMKMKRFIKGDGNLIGEVICRIYGSDDHFPDNVMEANNSFESLNYLASHDGKTLYDCTAYTDDSQQAWDCDGDEVLRRRQVKNMITLLMISNGTPMFRAGDEFCQTQNGQSNPYNIDDQTVWLDWSRINTYNDVYEFFKKIIAFRKKHHSLGRSRFWRDDVQWYGAKGACDLSSHIRTLAFFLNGRNSSQLPTKDDDIYVMINMYWDAVEFEFQVEGPWNRIINTHITPPNEFLDNNPEVIPGKSYLMGARSVAVFVK